MSLLKANGVAVLSGSVSMPASGVWTADLVIDQSDASGFEAGAAVTLAAEDGFELKGSVLPDRSGTFLDAVHVRIVGGKAGMGKTVQPRGYVQPGAYVRDVLNGIAGDAGEMLSDTIDAGFLGTNITAWSTFQATASQALNAFLSIVAPTAAWRFLADGKLWVGVETWPAASDEFDVLSTDPGEGTADLGTASPSILPGVTLDGVGKVAHVDHFIGEGGLRSHVWLDMAGEDRGIKGAVGAIVRQEMAHVDYFGLYECKVSAQSGDLLTVDVTPLAPVDKKLPGLQRVEVRAGTGIKVQFATGAKVLLGWKGGDPTLPYVLPGLGGDSPMKIQIAGTHPAPLWDTFLTDFNAFIVKLKADLTAGSGGGCTTTCTTPFVAATYESQIVSNG